jgi:Protein of unknown function (DUF1203)
MTFQIHALPYADFAPLFAADDKALHSIGIRRIVADAKPGFPCRVSLQDAEVGDELLLLNYQHLQGNTPYAASHAIYVRKNADQAQPMPDSVPTCLSTRLLSVRAFDSDKQMVTADVIDGADLAACLRDLFTNETIDFIHLHHARQGCFAASVSRAQPA